jgi:hypothetical protein
MPAKPAKPDRYVVDKVGSGDPPSTEYYVLDVVNDWIAREILARLGSRYREKGLLGNAKECFDLLDSTLEAHRVVMESRNPKQKTSAKRVGQS